MRNRRKLRTLLILAQRLRQARQCPNAFLEFCFRTATGAPMKQARLHRDLQQFLSTQPRALVELPRDHGKSTQICARLVWELGRNPQLRIVMVCAAEHLAIERGRYLRTAIEENPCVQLVFPHLQPASPWMADAFTVQRSGSAIGPSVSAFGIDACSTDTRADLLVCDDIVDVKAAYSKQERERVSEAFFNNVMKLLEPDGRFWNLSTPWHADDLNARLKRGGSYALFRRPVGRQMEPVWHERWGHEELTQRCQEIGSAAFARGYWLTPLAVEELAIRPEWVQCFEEPRASYERVILSVDPAITGHGDASALVVLGQVEQTIHCLHAWACRVTAPDLLTIIDDLDRVWQPEVIVFESNGAFEAVKDLFVRHARFGPKVLSVKQSRSKAARVLAFGVSVQNGSFLVRPTQRELIHEMTTFPFGEHDDLLDAAATGTAYLLGQPRQPRLWVF